MIFALNGQRGHSTEIPNQAQDKIARIVRSGWEAVHAVHAAPRARKPRIDAQGAYNCVHAFRKPDVLMRIA